MTLNSTEQFDVVVVGAGQAGLSAGYHLARRGLSFVLLDAAERIGDPWRNRWDSLRLFTPARYDGLPGLRYPGPAWHLPSKDEIADYIERYAQVFDLPVRTGVRVDRLSTDGDGGYVIAAGDDRFRADQVVVASGAFTAPRIPAFAPELSRDITQLHSRDYRNPSQLQDGGVLVVGAGNSGAEIALELSRSHQTWLSGRDTGEEPFRLGSLPDRLLTPPAWLVLSRVLTTKTSAGRKLRHKGLSMGHPLARVKSKDLTAAGIERAPMTAGVRDGYPVLEDGRVIQVPNVVWCTGFQPDFGWIGLPVFDDTGIPLHERGVMASQPGLYFVGQFFQHSLTSSLIGGVGRDAKFIAERIASRQRPATSRRSSALT